MIDGGKANLQDYVRFELVGSTRDGQPYQMESNSLTYLLGKNFWNGKVYGVLANGVRERLQQYESQRS